MKTKFRNIVRPIVFLPLVLLLVAMFGAWIDHSDTKLRSFVDYSGRKLQNILKTIPEDRVYLQFDKPFYKPGEIIWFSGYLRNGSDFKASEQSDILHVELINPKGNVMQHIRLIAKKGKASGDFAIDENAPGGMYKIKAYTNWQKNDPNPAIFEKEIQVQAVVLPRLKMKLDFERKAFGAGDKVIAKLRLQTNENKPLSDYEYRYVAKLNGKQFLKKEASTDEEGIQYIEFDLPENLKTNDGLLNVMIDYEGQTESISRSIPIVLNDIKFTFYPEGGDLIEDLQTKVAFRALNEFDKPADVEGVVLNSNGKEVVNFISYHQGMGAFDFKPKEGEKYSVKITKPKGINKIYVLPEALPKGYVLNIIENSTDGLHVNINSTHAETITLTAQLRGTIYYSNELEIKKGTNSYVIPVNEGDKAFPIGVAQFTLSDSKGIARAERLVFVNKHKQLNIKIETDKEKYLPREKVKMTVKVTDERGMPMPAQLSLAVVDDQLLTFADDKSGNILSKMLLEADIKGKIEEPAFYFDKKEAKADKALDYLLMTSGWRRFTWEQLISNDLPLIKFQSQKAIVAGTVVNDNNRIVRNANVKILQTGVEIKTDKNGRFLFSNIDLTQLRTLDVSDKEGRYCKMVLNDYNQNLNVVLYELVQSRLEGRVMGVKVRNAAGAGNNKGGKLVKDVELEKFEEPVNIVEQDKKDNKGNKEKNIKKNKQEINIPIEELEGEVEDMERMDDRIIGDDLFFDEKKKRPVQVIYHRAREFAAPIYDKNETVDIRTDFRSTVFWKGDLEVDRNGKTEIEFYNSDAITSFRTTIEGIGAGGSIGRTEYTHFTQLPFSMAVKVPVEVATEDIISIPLTLKNNTNRNITGNLQLKIPAGLQSLKKVSEIQKISANQVITIYLDYKVLDSIGIDQFEIRFRSQGLGDAFVQDIKIAPKGFPVELSAAASEMEKTFTFDIQNVVNGSIVANFTAYPSVVDDLMSGVESILREPYGCFEQTSMSSYPNALVLEYLKEQNNVDPKIIARAEKLLAKGYKLLITYETSEKGYEWFGGAPGHEALTAYGLMQFSDMKNVYKNIDNEMIDRTANWLMKRKDNRGGFARNPRALDSYGGAESHITNAYIVYALSEAGYEDIKKEVDHSYRSAKKSNDPYMLALMANAMYNNNDYKKGDELMKLLYKLQTKDGYWQGSKHSITRSTGISLKIETTSLAVMAILKSKNPNPDALNGAVKYIVSARSGYGGFGSTQSTILALKSLTAYAKFSKRTAEAGKIEIYIDKKKVAVKKYEAGEDGAIVIDNLEKYIAEGKHKIKVKYVGVENPLPYSLGISYNTFLPNSSDSCNVSIETNIAKTAVKSGETVRLSCKLKNLTNEGLPMTMAIIGIPAGFTAQPWQLKELQEKKIVDFYETSGNKVIFYYRQMKPAEIREINLDLKAEIKGSYEAPASCAYLYYTNEHKHWTKIDKVKIK